MSPTLGVVVVAWEALGDLKRLMPTLVPQLGDGDELIVVDNDSGDGSAEWLEAEVPRATVIRAGANLGFAAACNLGAARSSAEVLVMLNADTEVAPGWAAAIRSPAGGPWDAWMGLATRESGALINTSGNRVHWTGFSWAGGDGAPASTAPAVPAEIDCVSGVCMAMPAETWRRYEGFPEPFFTYHEDTDLSMRIRLDGGRLGLEPAAKVEHHYAFSRAGGAKWRTIERNRWALILRDYPGPLLALVMPGLVLTEFALLAVSASGGWLGPKLRANIDVLSHLPRLLRERREIQSRRQIGSAEFASRLVPDLGSQYFGRGVRSGPVAWGLRSYWRMVCAVLGSR